MDPVHALWIKRGERLADMILNVMAFLSRIRGMNRAPEMNFDPAEMARRSTMAAIAMRNAKDLRNEAIRDGARHIAKTVRSRADQAKSAAYEASMAETVPVRRRIDPR